MKRFKAKQLESIGEDAWNVYDNQADQFEMQHFSLTMNIRKEAAHEIAHIMNKEWSAFLRDSAKAQL